MALRVSIPTISRVVNTSEVVNAFTCVMRKNKENNGRLNVGNHRRMVAETRFKIILREMEVSRLVEVMTKILIKSFSYRATFLQISFIIVPISEL